MRWLVAITAILFVSPAFALGLGEVEGRAVIGRPLHITIPILGLAGDAAEAACATLLPDGDTEGLSGIRIKVAGDRVHLMTSRMLTQPILQFRVRLGCSGAIERSFLVLPDPASSADKAADTNRIVDVSREPPPGDVAQPVHLPQAAPAPGTQRSIVLMSSTSLRMLSRQRYPGDPDTRVHFIRQVAAANPDLFASEAAAFDQRIAAGTRLLVPSGVPEPHRRTVAAAPRAGAAPVASGAAHVTSQPADRRATKRATEPGRGRLIIGAEGLPRGKGPSLAELNETVDRLIEAMNQQVMVQIGLTERIKRAEADLAELKHQVQAEKLRVTQLASELKTVREAAERTGTIQLVLLILLGGLGGAWGLQWIARRKEARAERALPVTMSPVPTSESAAAVPPMASAFEDLFEQRDEILPPSGPRQD